MEVPTTDRTGGTDRRTDRRRRRQTTMAIPETRELLLAGLYPILDDDPFALTAAERRELGSSMRAEQAAWQVLLTRAAAIF